MMASKLTKFLSLFIPDIYAKGTVVSDVFEPNFEKIDQFAETIDIAVKSQDKNKLDKNNVPEKYNTAEKIGNEIDKKYDKTGGTISGNVVVTGNEVVNGSVYCNSIILNGYTITIE